MDLHAVRGLRQVPVSDFRRELADCFVEAVYRHRPLVLTRHEKEWAVLLGSEVFTALIDVMRERVNPWPVQILPEENGSLTLTCPDLGLYANGASLEEAKHDFLAAGRDYADDYLASLDLYLRDPARKNHLAFVLLAVQSSAEQLDRLFDWQRTE